MVQHPIAIPNQRGEFQIRNVLPKLSNLRHVKLLLFHSNGSHEGHINPVTDFDSMSFSVYPYCNVG
jgi:hypothetical protein